MNNVVIDGISIVLVDQCTVWRQKIYKRQNHLYTKDKSDEADKKRAQQQGDNIAFARGGAHLPISHALRLLSTKEIGGGFFWGWGANLKKNV